MSALTVTLGADITALNRAMAGATELVGASASRMGRLTGTGLAGLGKGRAVALGKGFSVAGTTFDASIISMSVAALRPSRPLAFYTQSPA
jgi:hypothetical protein